MICTPRMLCPRSVSRGEMRPSGRSPTCPAWMARSTGSVSCARPRMSAVSAGAASVGGDLLPAILPPAIDETRAAEEEDLQAPIDDDEGLAEIELAEHLRRQEDVVGDEKADRQEARGAHDVDEIGDRGEAPFRLIEIGSPVDERGAWQCDRKDERQMLRKPARRASSKRSSSATNTASAVITRSWMTIAIFFVSFSFLSEIISS